VEVRKGERGRFLQDLIATESMQLFAVTDPPTRTLKSAFRQSLTDEQEKRARRQFGQGSEQDFEAFLERSFIDSEVRHILFPGLSLDERGRPIGLGKADIERHFSGEQRAIARAIGQRARRPLP